MEKIKINSTINATPDKVWKLYNNPDDIKEWNNASPDWHTPRAENDLKSGGKFVYRMESKDGSRGFDFEGTYEEVKINELITYSMADGREVEVVFIKEGEGKTKVSVTFDADQEHSIEMQEKGWQAILDNFKKYAENHS